MIDYFATEALLPSGWARDVRIEVDERGTIAAVVVGDRARGATRLRGPALPGLCDVHCHAFQRAMAGLAERQSGNGDSFWTWRELMYAFVQRIGPEELEAIAAQLYVELLKGGFTSVCEFHYLHNDPKGNPYADPLEMSERIIAAAQSAGIGLTLLPVLYMTSDFGATPPQPSQRRFLATSSGIAEAVERLSQMSQTNPNLRFGVAPHSLRAVPPEALADCIRAIDDVDASAPVHIHVAEQLKEVQDCLAWSNRRPVEWLLEHHSLSSRWCLVHATHMTAAETERLARSGAIAGLCPTTEANLGDGLFPLADYLERGGSFGVGSDSNVSVSTIEELRWLEYGQRLAHRRRSIAATPATPSVGRTLYERAVSGGASAAGRAIGGIAPGQRADFIVLDEESPFLIGKTGDTMIDAFLFGGNTNPIREAIVGGVMVVTEGRHAAEAPIFANFQRALGRLPRR